MRKGFTLVEVVISAFVLALLSTVSMSLASRAVQASYTGRILSDLQNGCTEAVEQIDLDIEE